MPKPLTAVHSHLILRWPNIIHTIMAKGNLDLPDHVALSIFGELSLQDLSLIHI